MEAFIAPVETAFIFKKTKIVHVWLTIYSPFIYYTHLDFNPV